jgi:hypothetical protein
LWKRVGDFYEQAKKEGKNDDIKDKEETSIFDNPLKCLTIKNQVQNVNKKNEINSQIEKVNEININLKIDVDDSGELSTNDADLHSYNNKVNFKNFEIMFAKLLWYTTQIDISMDGFQSNKLFDGYILLKKKITEVNTKLMTYPDFEKIEIKQGTIKLIKSLLRSD